MIKAANLPYQLGVAIKVPCVIGSCLPRRVVTTGMRKNIGDGFRRLPGGVRDVGALRLIAAVVLHGTPFDRAALSKLMVTAISQAEAS